jgi:hypothetical protein
MDFIEKIILIPFMSFSHFSLCFADMKYAGIIEGTRKLFSQQSKLQRVTLLQLTLLRSR